MHARSASLGNPMLYSCCFCLHCFMPLKIAQVPRLVLEHSLNTVGCHRPREMVTGQGELVTDHKWGSQPTMNSRPALKMADRPSLPAESCLTAAEDRQSMAKHFQSNICTTTLLIMFTTQRSMVPDPRTINHAFQCMMAQRSQVCNFNVKWNAHKTNKRPPTPIIIDSRGKRCEHASKTNAT